PFESAREPAYRLGGEGAMARSTNHKTQTHRRIVQAASHALRARGVETVAIAGVMRAAGPAHGGFFPHLPPKEPPVAASLAYGLRDSRREFVFDAAEANPQAPLREVIRRYISRYHRDHQAEGCAMPALSAEIGRAPAEVRRAFTEGFEDYVARLESY